MWTQKKRKTPEKERKYTEPSPLRTIDDVQLYALATACSAAVVTRLMDDVVTKKIRGDNRDYRRVHRRDRLPEAHRRCTTPPRYWSLDDIGETKSNNE